jgi:hypothetical protein
VEADDGSVIVEYASVVAAIGVLVSTISGSFGQRLAALPTSNGTALTAVSAGARAQKVPPGEARAVYRQAPYKKPVLKYLYTVGWIGGKKSALSCLFARTQRDDTEREGLVEIRKKAKLVRQLRRVHVSLTTAAATLVRGIASACS